MASERDVPVSPRGEANESHHGGTEGTEEYTEKGASEVLPPCTPPCPPCLRGEVVRPESERGSHEFTTKPPRRLVVGWALLLFVIALAPRLIGLGWALPDASRYYSYHPDEAVLLWAIHQVRFRDLQLSPHFFNYGSLYLYLCRGALDLAATVGWVNLPPARPAALPMGTWVGDFARMHVIGRLVAALLGALTAVVTYGLGRRLFGEGAGRIAGLFMALAPLHLVHSHFLAVDVPATFWVTAALWAAARAWEAPARPRWLLAGVLAGFAAGTKYNAGLVALAAAAALVMAVRRAPAGRRRDAALDGGVYLFLGVVIGFLVATPGVLIDTVLFRYALAFERAHMAQGHDLVFVNTAPGWIYHVTESLGGGLGWPATLLCLAGFGWALYRRRGGDLLLLAYFVPYYLLIGSFQVKFARYVIPLLPVLAVWAGRLLSEAGPAWRSGIRTDPEDVQAHGRAARPRWRLLAGVAGAAALVAMALYAGALEALLVTPDTRTEAAAWVADRRPGVTVGLLRPPWYYTPPLSPGIGCVKQMRNFCAPDLPADRRVVAPPESASFLSLARLRAERPALVVVNEFEYSDPLRLARAGGPRTEMAELWGELRQNYTEVAVFRHRPRLGAMTWFARSAPPHDLLYIMPTTRVFERQASGD
jgi:4-amino-4-deoxy-L-arabinose transferase-like glycosyltransferase